MIQQLLGGLIGLIYPSTCLTCRRYFPSAYPQSNPLCPSCALSITRARPPFCRRCSRPLKRFDSPLCRECNHRHHHFERVWPACVFDDRMRLLLHHFKYGHKSSLRHLFADLIIEHIQQFKRPIHDYKLIVPVPLHPARQRERGYNQAELVARLVSGRFNIPLSTGNVIRGRHTPNQAQLRQKERWTNIQHAFTIKQPVEFARKPILIVDDLYTTGATTSEIARILIAAGAQRVSVITVAIALEYK